MGKRSEGGVSTKGSWDGEEVEIDTTGGSGGESFWFGGVFTVSVLALTPSPLAHMFRAGGSGQWALLDPFYRGELLPSRSDAS